MPDPTPAEASSAPSPLDGSTTARKSLWAALTVPVIVAALGYFVDMYDLVLVGVVKDVSLKDIGVAADDISRTGISLMNWQMIGMLLGGICWGIMGDKIGRVKMLFSAILVYSTANLLNTWVSSVEEYKILRIIAGFGLAGELGVGITLVVESLPTYLRGYGTMFVASIGVAGAASSYLVSSWVGWRDAFFIGGVMGFSLILMLFFSHESKVFTETAGERSTRGRFFSLFTNLSRFKRYMTCIAIGVPIWFVVGMLAMCAKEIGTAVGVVGEISNGKAVMWCFIGLIFGDFGSCLVSQLIGSRKRALWLFWTLTLLTCCVYFFLDGASLTTFYAVVLMLGVSTGYWALFVTVASEQFGTNLRSTVTTSVPNMVRGSLVPMTISYGALKSGVWGISGLPIVPAAIVVGVVCLGLSALAIYHVDETFSKDLKFNETN